MSVCNHDGHIFKFYFDQPDGYCIYCGELTEGPSLDEYGQNGLYMVMSPTQYRAAIKTLGLSQVRAGGFLGVGARTSRRWALDESAIPASVGMLLRLMIKLNLKPEDVK